MLKEFREELEKNALLMQGALATLYGASMIDKNKQNQKLMRLPNRASMQGKRLPSNQSATSGPIGLQNQSLYQRGIA